MTLDSRLEAAVVDDWARNGAVDGAEQPLLPRPFSPLPYSISGTVTAPSQHDASQERQESLHLDERQHSPPLAEVEGELLAC